MEHTIDITPESMKTPEGAQRVNAALKEFEDSHADVANAATRFVREYGYVIEQALKDDEPGAQDFAELRALMDERAKKQDNFLRALSGRGAR